VKDASIDTFSTAGMGCCIPIPIKYYFSTAENKRRKPTTVQNSCKEAENAARKENSAADSCGVPAHARDDHGKGIEKND
jgi:hypothetical protein